jgi:hypothetical protein
LTANDAGRKSHRLSARTALSGGEYSGQAAGKFALGDWRGSPKCRPEEMRRLIQSSLEKRYVWRVASALKWAFADFDNFNVTADKETLSPEDRAKVLDLLKVRPIQFYLFLKALVGPEEMKRVMIQAISTAGRLP